MRTLRIPRGNFNAVCYTADGAHLVGLHSGGRLRVWATADFAERFVAPLPVKVPLLETCRLVGDLAVTSRGVYSLGRVWAALSAGPGTVRDRTLIDEVHLEGRPQWSTLVLSPDGTTIYAVEANYRRGADDLLRWDLTGQAMARLGLPAMGHHFAVSPDGVTVALLYGMEVFLVGPGESAVLASLPHSDAVQRALFSPDGARLAVGAGRSLWVWDLATRRGERLRAFDKYVSALAFRPDGSLMAADNAGEIRHIDPASGRQLACLNFEVGAIHDLAFSPDGMTVAGAGHDNAVVVWDLE
ncbi:MAG: WD40 repeat domain-containing protein [Gemmataceae bacterium]